MYVYVCQWLLIIIIFYHLTQYTLPNFTTQNTLNNNASHLPSAEQQGLTNTSCNTNYIYRKRYGWVVWDLPRNGSLTGATLRGTRLIIYITCALDSNHL